MRTLAEGRVRLALISLMILIVVVTAAGAFQYVQELKKQEYFLNLTAERTDDFADLKMRDKLKAE